MSTRCNVIINNGEKSADPTIFYHHCDGYPDGVGNELKNILKQYTSDNNTYSISEIISEIMNKSDEYELENRIAGDIEYLYDIIVYKGNIFYTCYKVPACGSYDINTEKNCKRIESYEYNQMKALQEKDENNNIDSCNKVIVDTKELLDYVNKRNKFLDELMEKYCSNDTIGIPKDKFKEILEVTYNHGYNSNKEDNI